ncbi:MAG: DUF5606 domain-containing protein [Cyclobacteriaceae bacterium]
MELSEIASISGKGGLFKILKPGKAGVVLESMDGTKTKIVAGASHRVSVLNEISIYTTTKEGTVALADVLKKINETYGSDLGVDGESDGKELQAFLKSVLPEFDIQRVYVSDIKKLVKWYSILLKEAPEVLKRKQKPRGFQLSSPSRQNPHRMECVGADL